MTTTALPLEVRKVQTFSRVARRICAVALVLLALGAVVGISGVLFGAPNVKVGFGPYTMDAAHFTTPLLKAWGVSFLTVILGLALLWVQQLHALFANLARGAIFTSDNVQRIRRLAFLMILVMVTALLLGTVSLAFLRAGFIDEAAVTMLPSWGSLTPGSFMAFAGPGLILLISWIMEVGRKTRDEADEMRRETELVV